MVSPKNDKDYSAVIFDLFHTLTSLESVIAPGKGTSTILGLTRETWNEQLLQHSQERLRGRLTDPFMVIKKMAHEVDPEIKDATIRRAFKVRCKRFRYALENIDPDVIKTLVQIKRLGMKLGLVSNADVMEIAAWPDSPLKKYFDQAIFSSDVGFIKPEKEIFEICLKKLDARPVCVLYAGDGGSDELKTAKGMGMTTVLVTHIIKSIWPERIAARRQYADHEIEQVSEILTILRRCSS